MKKKGASYKIGIVVSRFNQGITQKLLNGALKTLKSKGSTAKKIVWVPGAFEIPVAAKKIIQSHKLDAVVCLGCVLQGETPHNHYIANAVSDAIMNLSLEFEIPVTFGVLTPNTYQQAQDRSGNNSSNKGMEATEAALEMIDTLRTLK